MLGNISSYQHDLAWALHSILTLVIVVNVGYRVADFVRVVGSVSEWIGRPLLHNIINLGQKHAQPDKFASQYTH